MIRFAALALSLGLSNAVIAADPPKPEPPKTEEKKPDYEAQFKKKDANSDGKLTLEEFKGKLEGEKATMAEKQFKRLDKDSDGKLTLEEFKTRPMKKAK